jgi:hypothetical protein
MTATFTVTSVQGEINSQQVNLVDVNQPTGSAQVILGLIEDGAFETYWNVIVNFPRIKPRVCIPAETNEAKPRC